MSLFIESVTKRFGDVLALDGVSFEPRLPLKRPVGCVLDLTRA